MPPVFTYIEEQGDTSPASASFTPRSQSASAPYNTFPITYTDMPNRLIDVLGYTGTQVLDGRINRVLPLRHPQFQWLFCDSFRPRGVGITNQLINPFPGPGSAIIPTFPLYATYTCDISFSQRDYNSWQDSDIKLNGGTGYAKDGTTYQFSYATEWLRFCVFETSPLNQYIDAKQGQMTFRASGPGGAVPPDGIPFQDAPRMYLPDSSLKVRWYQVPYRYLTSSNSYLRNFVGYLNQVAWGDQPLDPFSTTFGPYQPGQLLYLGARPISIYSNVVPDEGLLAFNQGNGFSRARLCDLELEFIFTARTIGTPTANTPDFSSINGNWIVAGHNLLPWLTTRQYFYATTFNPSEPTDKTQWFPTFPSFPFSLLFTDPDAAQSPQLLP